MDGGENTKFTPSNVENTSDKAVSKQQIWEREIHSLNLYHGTSISSAERIMRVGMKPDEKPYELGDQKFIEMELSLRGIEMDKYSHGKDKVFFVESSLSDTTGYAISGPEIIKYYLLPKSGDLMKMMEGENGLTSKDNYEYSEVKRIHEKLLKSVYEHRPALLKIKRESESFKNLVNKRLGGEWQGILDNYEVFEKVVSQIQTNENIDVKNAVEYVIDIIKKSLFNVPVKDVVKPEDLELIKGVDFDNLNRRTKELAEVRKKCFADDERQVPQVLELLDKKVFFNYGSREEIVSLCEYYEIGKQDAEKFWNRAIELQEENKKNVVE